MKKTIVEQHEIVINALDEARSKFFAITQFQTPGSYLDCGSMKIEIEVNKEDGKELRTSVRCYVSGKEVMSHIKRVKI